MSYAALLSKYLIFDNSVLLKFLLFLLPVFPCLSANAWSGDTSKVEVRKFDESGITKYKKQPDFIYENERASDAGFWQWILGAFGRLLEKLFGARALPTLIRIIFYLLMISGMAAIILNLLGINVQENFYPRIAAGR